MKKSKRNSAIVAIVLASLLIFSSFIGCIGDWMGLNLSNYKYKFEDSFAADLEGAEELSISIINGPIEVETWDQDRVEIEVHERIKAPDEDAAKELGLPVLVSVPIRMTEKERKRKVRLQVIAAGSILLGFVLCAFGIVIGVKGLESTIGLVKRVLFGA